MKISFKEIKEKKKQSSPSTDDEANISQWVVNITDTLGILERMPLNSSIYKVPHKLRQINPDAYTPRIVSLGPFHHGHSQLLAMEEHKWHYMLHLLHRVPQVSEVAEPIPEIPELARTRSVKCARATLSMDAQVRGSFSESIPFSNCDLAEIMLVDGCFILELFLRHSAWYFVGGADPSLKSDPIFNNAWMLPSLRYDLALLENQLPLSVLEKLFDVIKPHMPKRFPESIIELALFFFYPSLKSNPISEQGRKKEFRHLLDLLHVFYLPSSPRVYSPKEISGFKHCTTKLVQGGIRIRKSTNSDRLLDIKFSKGDLTIPTIPIDHATESLLRNLIAFEQCSLRSSYHITSYAFLIQSLIETSRDIEFLQQKGVITGNLGGGGLEDASPIFRGLCRDIVQKEYYFAAMCDEVNVFHKSWWRWQRCRAALKVRWRKYVVALKTDYFSNPWRIISFFAAVMLLLLTGLQTFYTVRGYYPH